MIDSDRLADILKLIKNISRSALSFETKGFSKRKPGRVDDKIQEATIIYLGETGAGSTQLKLHSPTFAEARFGEQLELFDPNRNPDFLSKTALTLAIEALSSAFDVQSDNKWYDRSMYDSIADLRKTLRNDTESWELSNQKAESRVEISYKNLTALKKIKLKIPQAKESTISGELQRLSSNSKAERKAKIKSQTGIIDAVLADHIDSSDFGAFFGRHIVVEGTAHYRNETDFVLEVERFRTTQPGDEIFSYVGGESIEAQIERQQRSGASHNPLSEIAGQWPGDETYEELIAELKETRRGAHRP